MLSCPVWSDIDARFTNIPAERIDYAISLLRSRTQPIFPDDLPDEVLLSALRSRLRLCRGSWQDGQRRNRRRAPAFTDPGQQEAPEVSELAVEEEVAEPDRQSQSPRSLRIILKIPSPRKQNDKDTSGIQDPCVDSDKERPHQAALVKATPPSSTNTPEFVLDSLRVIKAPLEDSTGCSNKSTPATTPLYSSKHNNKNVAVSVLQQTADEKDHGNVMTPDGENHKRKRQRACDECRTWKVCSMLPLPLSTTNTSKRHCGHKEDDTSNVDKEDSAHVSSAHTKEKHDQASAQEKDIHGENRCPAVPSEASWKQCGQTKEHMPKYLTLQDLALVRRLISEGEPRKVGGEQEYKTLLKASFKASAVYLETRATKLIPGSRERRIFLESMRVHEASRSRTMSCSRMRTRI